MHALFVIRTSNTSGRRSRIPPPKNSGLARSGLPSPGRQLTKMLLELRTGCRVESCSCEFQLVLAMGNYLNKGNSRVDQASGFRINFLTQVPFSLNTRHQKRFQDTDLHVNFGNIQ